MQSVSLCHDVLSLGVQVFSSVVCRELQQFFILRGGMMASWEAYRRSFPSCWVSFLLTWFNIVMHMRSTDLKRGCVVFFRLTSCTFIEMFLELLGRELAACRKMIRLLRIRQVVKVEKVPVWNPCLVMRNGHAPSSTHAVAREALPFHYSEVNAIPRKRSNVKR